jgi:NAD(P) transhydrogenase subunit beta
MMNWVMQFSYLFSAVLFIFGLKFLSSPRTAKKGNIVSMMGMSLAVFVTILSQEIIEYSWIIVGIVIGSCIGVFCARKVKMTAMPEMVALLNGLGGVSSLLVGWSAYHMDRFMPTFLAVTVLLSVWIGGITFTGSMVAWAKLQGKIATRPILFFKQHWFNAVLVALMIGAGVVYTLSPATSYPYLIGMIVGSLVLGVLSVLPIGGADMPVVISLLNSYSGLAACATGFVMQNNILIVSGALVGASGIILTSIMCKAMNRCLSNVLFSGFGSSSSSVEDQGQQKARSIEIDDAYYVLEAAKTILIVPGYGLAVAQAQHILKELASLFTKNGADVTYAIHPVAGRMPGHMNVLLAEAGIAYDQLVEMDHANPTMDTIDVCLVIGANDVVNPSAKEDPKSPIYGMPIIEAYRAKHVFILKRSMASGFAGIQNPLFFKENANMLFGDAKQTLQGLVMQLKA